MKKLPVGIQSFREIVQGGYVYVDKTRYVYDLVNNAKYYFLSRPRRFGKSLFLDTIAEAFSSGRELFKGLWIYDSDYDFQTHPVLRLDMSGIANETPEVLKNSLASELRTRINAEGFDVSGEVASDLLKNLIEALYKKYGKRVVVLIDEYDKPILDHLHNTDMAEANRAVIRGFYGVLKSMDACLRFTFITGVSKFTKTSIFSELNNLLDITLIDDYANICGIPVEDLDRCFHEHIEALSSLDRFKQYENIHDEILAWYDGYSWDGATRVLNPFGLLTFFAQKRFSSFWYSTGSPKFLIAMIRNNPESYTDFRDFEMGEWELDSFDVNSIQAAPLLFQTGYLTVREVLHGMGSTAYLLDIPNCEVREAFNLQMLAVLTERENAFVGTAYRNILKSLRDGDLNKILSVLKGFFASIPYNLHIPREAYYHSIFFTVMSLLGFDIEVEVATSKGRIDAVLEMKDKVYVFEFKYKDCDPGASAGAKRTLFDEALKEGLAQIIGRGYADKYLGSGKVVYQAAFAFLGMDDIEMKVEEIVET